MEGVRTNIQIFYKSKMVVEVAFEFLYSCMQLATAVLGIPQRDTNSYYENSFERCRDRELVLSEQRGSCIHDELWRHIARAVAILRLTASI